MNRNIVENIIKLKDAKGWSQGQLAREAGMSTSTICKIIKGERNISSKSLIAIANAFGVSTSALFSDDVSREPAPPKVLRCPWQKKITIIQTITDETRKVLFGDCLENACPYWFDMNGEMICRRVEWPND